MQTFQRTMQGEWRGQIKFSPDGRWLAVSSDTYTPYAHRLPAPFVLFDTTGQEPPKELPCVDAPFLFVRHGAAVVFRLQSWKHSQLGALDLKTGKVREVPLGGEWDPWGFAAGPGGETFYVCVRTLSGTVVKTSSGPSEVLAFGAKDLKLRGSVCKTKAEANGLMSSADGNWVAVGSNKGVQLWNVSGAKRAKKPALHLNPQDGAAALSADGGLLVSPGQYALRAFNTATGELVFSSGKHKRAVWSAACCPTRPLIASGDSKGNVFFWDHTGNVLKRYDWGLKDGRALCFAPDGLRCAAADGTGKVVVWDVDV
jgi:WD40 repeat protein